MINQYKEQQRKVQDEEDKKQMIQKVLSKGPKKIKLSKKQKRLDSLVSCFDKRVINYPGSRKWLGNFNELVY